MTKIKPKLQIEILDIDALIPYENNAKLHPQEQIDQIARSIEEFGNNDPIAVDENNVIIEGHGRLLALQQLGHKTAEVIRLSHLSDEQRRAYTLVHNKLTTNTGYDLELLELELASITNIDMDSLGFDDIEIDQLPEVVDDEYDLPDDLDERTSNIKQGDMFKLGEHVLLCGDSTSIDDVEKLMGGDSADLVNTDPPYNVNYEGTAGKIQNDNMSDSQFDTFLQDVFKAMKHALKEGGAFYIWHAESTRAAFSNALTHNDLRERQTLIWVKNTLVLGRQDYQWKHEPCLYGWKEGAAHYFIDDFTNTTVIEDMPNINNMSKDELKYHIKELRRKMDEVTTIIREDKPSSNPLHPTMKPVRMIADQIVNSSRKGEIVLDLFGGSGSTLMACEQTGRKARLMELDPVFCDVIIERYEAFTGEKAIKIG